MLVVLKLVWWSGSRLDKATVGVRLEEKNTPRTQTVPARLAPAGREQALSELDKVVREIRNKVLSPTITTTQTMCNGTIAELDSDYKVGRMRLWQTTLVLRLLQSRHDNFRRESSPASDNCYPREAPLRSTSANSVSPD